MLALVALALSVSLAMCGCVQVASSITTSLGSAKTNDRDKGKPKTGECWAGSFKGEDSYGNWNGGAAVSCSAKHELYTFAVKHLEDAHSGALFTSAGYVHDAIWQDAFNTCDDAETDLRADLDGTDQRDTLETYLPESKQWNAGARWVRCDIGILALGSSVAHPQFEDLPAVAELRSEFKSTPKLFDFCTTIPVDGSGGPKGKDAVYANCLDNPQWMFVDDDALLPGSDDGYPSKASMTADYQRLCASKYADATHQTYPYYPSRSEWKEYETFECWVGRK
jgi:hypothetical protein